MIDRAVMRLDFCTFIFIDDILAPPMKPRMRISQNSGCPNRLFSLFGRRRLASAVPIFVPVARYSFNYSRIPLSVTRECVETKGKE